MRSGERERKKEKQTVMIAHICLVSLRTVELSKKHLMPKWGQREVKKRYLSGVINISVADSKRPALFMRGGGVGGWGTGNGWKAQCSAVSGWAPPFTPSAPLRTRARPPGLQDTDPPQIRASPDTPSSRSSLLTSASAAAEAANQHQFILCLVQVLG